MEVFPDASWLPCHYSSQSGYGPCETSGVNYVDDISYRQKELLGQSVHSLRVLPCPWHSERGLACGREPTLNPELFC